VRLIAASLAAPASLPELVEELSGGRMAFTWDDDFAAGRMTLQAYVQLLVDFAAGRNLRDDWVPMTTFWLLDDAGEVIGLSRLRHRLNDLLRIHGGHIGYYVARDHRDKGFGTQILALTLVEARRLGLDRVLLTVDSSNERSIRVIERNGGAMEEECIDEATGRLHRRYWIDLT
jgi:predicted acetyltransferase